MPQEHPASGEHVNIPGTCQQPGNTHTHSQKMKHLVRHINILGTHSCLGTTAILQENNSTREFPWGTSSHRDTKGARVSWWLFPTPPPGRALPRLTLDFSSSRVIMTTVAVRCSHTIRQKSPIVSGRGPCVAM